MSGSFAITASGLKPIGDEVLYLAPGQRYYFGASSSPEMVIVTEVPQGDERFPLVQYYSYPYRKPQRCELDIFKHLADEGCRTWLKSRRANYHPEIAASLRAVLENKPGANVDYRDYQPVMLEVAAPEGVDDPWSDWERRLGLPDVSSSTADGRTLHVPVRRGEAARLQRQIEGSGYAIIGQKED